MSALMAQGVALVLFILAYPLVSIGTTQGIGALWWLGLLFLVVAGLIPPVMRYVGSEDEESTEE